MPRILTIVVALGVIGGGSAFGQTAPTTPIPATPMTQSTPPSQAVPPTAPVPGANSFTESEARHRLADHGYTDVLDLKKDDQGIWRGMAMKDGKSVPVALDYKGNIVSQ